MRWFIELGHSKSGLVGLVESYCAEGDARGHSR